MSHHNKTCRVCTNRKPAKKKFWSKGPGDLPHSECTLYYIEVKRTTPRCKEGFKEKRPVNAAARNHPKSFVRRVLSRMLGGA